jgi:hypothetical protein
VVYLNGQFATQGYWKRVLAELGPGFRHITYDERARGKSKRSADYSFEVAEPYDWIDEAMEQLIRKLFKRMGWFLPVLRPTGLAPRMSAAQQGARVTSRSGSGPRSAR